MALYTWRSQKSFEEPYNIFILGLALLSVARAWIFSFLMSWFTPTVGLGCRSITELSYFMAWCFSCALTQMFRKYTDSSRTQNAEAKRKRDKCLFFAIIMKDAMFATPMTLALFLAFKGWWDSCDCWSARWTLGFKIAQVLLGSDEWEQKHNYFYYAMIAGALGFQITLTFFMLLLHRDGLRLIYRDEEDMGGFYKELEQRQIRRTQVEV